MIYSLRFRKDVFILKMLLCFGFCTFGFESIPYASCYLTSIGNKTHHGPVIAHFLCNFCSFFSYAGGILVIKKPTFFHCYWFIYSGYSASYNTRRAFVIIFFICSDLLNCLRSVGTIVITTESGFNSLKVIFTEQFLTKTTIFRCFDVLSARSPQIFQVQAKISTIPPVFPDYLSVCYDYGYL